MIDIIIPVFNATKEVKLCVASVLKNLDKKSRVVIVNDKSTDADLLKYFKSLETKDRVTVIHHKKNQGFVGSVNTGMSYSKKNDVILLNSDTIVTSNWVEKMRVCAYSSDVIASVTPLSNNATICSVPNFGVDNEIPKGFSVNSFGQLIERVSLQSYPSIPTAVGFCMYIKRSVLDIAGLFDKKLFGKGYGEENEFCLRTRELGYEHVLDDTTFIYHSGSASFTDERRKERVKIGMQKINKLYPLYEQEIQNFLENQPLKAIHRNIKFWIDNTGDKPNILFMKHHEPTTGGTGVNTYQIVKNSKEYNFYVLYPTEDESLTIERWISGKQTGKMLFKRGISDFLQHKSWFRNIEDIFQLLIQTQNISLVHFQHLAGFPLSLLTIANDKKVPTILSVHDFYTFSPDLFMSNVDNSTTYFLPTVTEYISHLETIGNRKAQQYLKRFIEFKEYLKRVTTIIAPSDFVASQFKEHIKATVKVIEHGISFKKITQTKDYSSEKLTLAFIGVGEVHKGILDFLEIAKDPQIRKQYNLEIIGDISESVKQNLDSETKKVLRKIKISGYYDHADIQEILMARDIDIIILPASCAETFSYTLSEAIQTNIPVIGRNIGAIGQRIKAGKLGWTFNTIQEAKETLLDLAHDRSKVSEKQPEISKIEMKTVEEMVKEYTNAYNSIIKKESTSSSHLNSPRENRFLITAITQAEDYVLPRESSFFKLKKQIRSLPIVGESIYSGYVRLREGLGA